MIALQRIEPEPSERRRPTRDRSREATRRRVLHARRRTFVGFARIAGVMCAVLAPLMLYVMLTANLTTLSYRIAHVQTERSALVAQTQRNENRIAGLESRERLAHVAAGLHMHDPQTFAVVQLPAPPAPDRRLHGIALMGAVGHWFSAAVGGPAH